MIEFLEGILEFDKQKKYDIEIVIDCLVIKLNLYQWLVGFFEMVFKVGNGLVLILVLGMFEEILFQSYGCMFCGDSISEIILWFFFFNSFYGVCEMCSGLGMFMVIDFKCVVGDFGFLISEGVLLLLLKSMCFWCMCMICILVQVFGFELMMLWCELLKKICDFVLFGIGDCELQFEFKGKCLIYQWKGIYEGVVLMFECCYCDIDFFGMQMRIEEFMLIQVCFDCDGCCFKFEVFVVFVLGYFIDQFSEFFVSDLCEVVVKFDLSEKEKLILGKVLQEVCDWFIFFYDVGVGYFSFGCVFGIFFGGESQCICFVMQIGSKFMGVFYVFDELFIGLY